MQVKTTRRIAGWLSGAIVSGVLLAGSASAQTTVTMWTFLDPNKTSPREVALKQMVADFEAANPGIKVSVEPQDFAQMPSKFFLGHRTGGNPDIVWIDAKNLAGLDKSGSGADLDALVASKWPQADRDDYYAKAAWDAALFGKTRMALPIFNGGSMIYYRKDLLAKAGIDPKSLTTWDALLKAAKVLTVDNDKDGRIDVWGLGMPLSPLKTEASPVYISLLEKPDALYTDGCKAHFATDLGVKGITYTADAITREKVTPQEALVLNVDDITDQFIAGRYAIAIGSNLRYSVIRSRATFGKDNFDIMKWPSWDGKKPGATPLSGWWVSIWKNSQHQAEAAKFVDYMLGPKGVTLWSTIGGQVPTRSSILKDKAFAGPENDWVRLMIDAWTQTGYMDPPACNTRTLQGALNEATARVVIDKADPMVALKEAEQKFADAQ
jgi:multiple sugar transport system substrate-binding protein